MTLADECRRMADLLPGAPGVAELLRRASGALESIRVEADRELHRAVFDAGAEAARRALLGRIERECSGFLPQQLEGRP